MLKNSKYPHQDTCSGSADVTFSSFSRKFKSVKSEKVSYQFWNMNVISSISASQSSETEELKEKKMFKFLM